VNRLPEPSREAAALHRDALVVDLHCDTMLSQALYGLDPLRPHRNPLPFSPLTLQADLPRLQEGGVGCVALGVVVNPLRRESAPWSVWRYLERLKGWQDRAPDRVQVVSRADDVEEARRAGKLSIFAGLEGAHGLGGRLDELAAMRRAGLRYVGLAHFTRNQAVHPAFGWGADASAPLSNFGRDLVDELVRQHIIIDLAHINRRGFFEVCERAQVPMYVSHTGVQGAHRSWRNIDDDQLRAVAKNGGVVGIIFTQQYLGGGLLASIGRVAAHVLHVVSAVGEDHVALGTDVDGFVVLPRDFPDVRAMPRVTEALLRSGLSETAVRKALGLNALRVFREVCG
jgi:membrane dipeptidase